MGYGDGVSNKPLKNKQLSIRVTPTERAIVHENAKRRNMSVSRYIRYRCLFDKN